MKFAIISILARRKNEPGPSAVKRPASDARVLRIDTKVVENFFNSKYYTENFSRLEEDAKNAEQIQRKAAEQPAPDTTVKPVATDNRTIQEKMAAMATYIPDESYINNERQSKNSTVRTSQPGENASRFVKSGANVIKDSEFASTTIKIQALR